MNAEQRAKIIAEKIFYYDDEDLYLLTQMTANHIKQAEQAAREDESRKMQEISELRIKKAEQAAFEEGRKAGSMEAIGTNVPVAAGMAYVKGFEDGRKSVIDELALTTGFPMKLYENAFQDGQREMRERAADLAQESPCKCKDMAMCETCNYHWNISENIRALPLTESGKEDGNA